MDQLLLKLANLGSAGAIIAILAYDIFYMQKKLIQIIENNTKAMTSLADQCRYHTENETQFQHSAFGKERILP